jgi:hypothetical protein
MNGALKSKTMWFNAAIAVVGVLEMQQAVLTQYVGPQNIGAVMMGLAVIGALLRVITTSALSDK